MSTWEIVLLILFGICLMGALVRKRWNDFFYFLCIGMLIVSDLPIPTYIISLIFLIILHRYIEKKESEQKENESNS